MRRAVGAALSGMALFMAASGVDAGGRSSAPRVQGAAQAQPDPAACKGFLTQSTRLPGVLSAVPRYGSAYVLVVPARLAASVPNANVPGLKTVEVGVHKGTDAVEVARALGVTRIREYPLDLAAPAQPLLDVRDGKLDTAILWAPLAGLAMMEFGLGNQVSVFTVDKPRRAPAELQAPATPDPCAIAIAAELEANGAVPAELLVSVDFRTLLGRKPPEFSLASAREGGPLYNEACSTCHGPDAVADPNGLAPVDLRTTVPRLSYAGFSFIILNGRPEKSMPPMRGTVTDEQIALIYQYLKARTDRLLPAASR